MHSRQFSKKITYERVISAANRNEIIPYYQPQYCSRSNTCHSVEVLMRWNWNHSVLLTADKFLGSLNKLQLMNYIGFFLLESVCNNMCSQAWGKISISKISVNFSGDQMLLPDFSTKVLRIIEASGISPCQFTFELTETDRFIDVEKLKGVLIGLRSAGINISLDDFCTGFSTMEHLKILPIDEIKIDRSFVERVYSCDGSRGICAGLIAIASNLGIRVIAEGVENIRQFRALQSLGCENFQGFFYGKPVSADELVLNVSQGITSLALVEKAN